jgi:hypothetical protein
MKLTKSLRVFLGAVFLSVLFAANVFAQCSGIYFKPVSGEGFTPFAIFDSLDYEQPLQKDINSDGKIDLVGRSVVQHGIYISYGEPNGNFGNPVFLPFPNNSTSYQFFAEDFDHDGLQDFLVNFNNNSYVVYRNDGNGSFTPLGSTSSDNVGVTNFVDINNDNRPDITNGYGYRLANADGTFAAPVALPASVYLGKLAADFNNDGLKDFRLFSIPAACGLP